MVEKVRPVLILSIPFADADRVLGSPFRHAIVARLRDKSGLAEMEGRIAGPALRKLLTVNHAMRTLV
jgi:hypothetical protein